MSSDSPFYPKLNLQGASSIAKRLARKIRLAPFILLPKPNSRWLARSIIWLAVAFVLIGLLQPTPAYAFVVYNETGQTVSVQVREGDFRQEIPPGDWEACHWTNTDCNPSGEQGAMLTVQIETEDFTCVIAMPAGGYAVIKAMNRDAIQPGLLPNLVCTSYHWDHHVIDQQPYGAEMTARDVRFLATTDPQYDLVDGGEGADVTMAHLVDQIKQQASYRGILIAGDLTHQGCEFQWDMYNEAMSGYSRFVYDGLGNHDVGDEDSFNIDCVRWPPNPFPVYDTIKEDITGRKRSMTPTAEQAPHYSWDWHDVHFVQLNIFPANDKTPSAQPEDDYNDPHRALDFLTSDLATYVGGSGRPVVLIHHYGFDADISLDPRWWTAAQRQAYWDAIAPYNVIAIFTGHVHPRPDLGWLVYSLVTPHR